VLRNILSVGAWTLVSRATGFLRDVVMAAILGTGPMADAFVVAFKLPNHFRAIFGEGAFNAAFVPAYSRVREQQGAAEAARFQGRIVSLLLLSQAILLALASLFMPQVVGLIAPGFKGGDGRLDLAIELSRITFPYLLLITLATLYGGVLNAMGRFTAAAAAPILLNIVLVAALLAAPLFPTAAHAAAWGVTLSGLLQLAVLILASRRAGVLAPLRRIRFDPDTKGFLRALGPATIGSMGVQIAMFADTIIATLLPTGAVSALYYADRVYQLPLGVIGIAAGTVLLPEMSRLVAAGRPAEAARAQNRTMLIAWLMAAPFFAAFIIVPELIMRAFFVRGAFTLASADAAGSALLAYGAGLPAVILIRSAVASFYARGDTATPLWASLTAVAINILFKILLMGPLEQAGLALATSIGAWVNLGLLVVLASGRGAMRLDRRNVGLACGIALAAAAMAGTMALLEPWAVRLFAAPWAWRDIARLAVVGGGGAMVYCLAALVLLHIGGLRMGRIKARPASVSPAPPGSRNIPPAPPSD
jgi:putative peptidoglycan lipid II flippase